MPRFSSSTEAAAASRAAAATCQLHTCRLGKTAPPPAASPAAVFSLASAVAASFPCVAVASSSFHAAAASCPGGAAAAAAPCPLGAPPPFWSHLAAASAAFSTLVVAATASAAAAGPACLVAGIASVIAAAFVAAGGVTGAWGAAALLQRSSRMKRSRREWSTRWKRCSNNSSSYPRLLVLQLLVVAALAAEHTCLLPAVAAVSLSSFASVAAAPAQGRPPASAGGKNSAAAAAGSWKSTVAGGRRPAAEAGERATATSTRAAAAAAPSMTATACPATAAPTATAASTAAARAAEGGEGRVSGDSKGSAGVFPCDKSKRFSAAVGERDTKAAADVSFFFTASSTRFVPAAARPLAGQRYLVFCSFISTKQCTTAAAASAAAAATSAAAPAGGRRSCCMRRTSPGGAQRLTATSSSCAGAAASLQLLKASSSSSASRSNFFSECPSPQSSFSGRPAWSTFLPSASSVAASPVEAWSSEKHSFAAAAAVDAAAKKQGKELETQKTMMQEKWEILQLPSVRRLEVYVDPGAQKPQGRGSSNSTENSRTARDAGHAADGAATAAEAAAAAADEATAEGEAAAVKRGEGGGRWTEESAAARAVAGGTNKKLAMLPESFDYHATSAEEKATIRYLRQHSPPADPRRPCQNDSLRRAALGEERYLRLTTGHAAAAAAAPAATVLAGGGTAEEKRRHEPQIQRKGAGGAAGAADEEKEKKTHMQQEGDEEDEEGKGEDERARRKKKEKKMLLQHQEDQEQLLTPVWMMRQAGRYLPEFRAVRARHSFVEVCRDPVLASEVTLQPYRRFPLLDAVIIFSDILVIPEAMGMAMTMPETGGPRLSFKIQTPADIRKLVLQPDIERTLGYVLDAIYLTSSRLEGRIPLIGFCGAPLTLLLYMIEGGGSSSSWREAKKFLYEHRKATHLLLRSLTNACVEFLIGQADAGAQVLQIFDSHAGILEPEFYEEVGAAYMISIAEQVKARRPHVVLVAFPRDRPSAAFSLSAFDVVSLSHSADIREMRQRFQQLPVRPEGGTTTAARAGAAGPGAAAKGGTTDIAAASGEKPLLVLSSPAASAAGASKHAGAVAGPHEAQGEGARRGGGGADRRRRSSSRTKGDEEKYGTHVKALQGNLDPQILYANIDTIREETSKMIERFGVGRHIANLGHGMEPLMLPEHAAAFINAVKEASARLLQQRRK